MTQTACEQQQNYDGSPIKQHHQLATAMQQRGLTAKNKRITIRMLQQQKLTALPIAAATTITM